MTKNIGFVSTRFAGTDGVTLEASKWAQVLKSMGHNYFWFAGLLVTENVLTIPMHIPLGIALTELIAETQIPTIAHHHDFYWEW